MTRLKDKLEAAMRVRTSASGGDTASKPVDSRFEKADRLMAGATPEQPSASDVNVADGPPPAANRQPSEGKRVIRDTFSLPPKDYARIQALRGRARRKDVDVSKSEIVRAGLLALDSLSISEFLSVVARLDRIKTGRPEMPKQERRKRSA
jgi:hypothetical protein